jgi:hypothetical protein
MGDGREDSATGETEGTPELEGRNKELSFPTGDVSLSRTVLNALVDTVD